MGVMLLAPGHGGRKERPAHLGGLGAVGVGGDGGGAKVVALQQNHSSCLT